MYGYSILAKCSMYEIESDEKFQIELIGSSSFLTVYSKDFDISFLLKCYDSTKIYAKISKEQLEKGNFKDHEFIKIKTDIEIDKIQLSSNKNDGNIKEIKFFLDKKILNSKMEDETINLTKSNNDDVVYSLSKTSPNQSSLPLGFKCSMEYFANERKIEALSFEGQDLDTDYILQSIKRWEVESVDNDNKNLISWFTNCKKWSNYIKNEELENLYSIDKQIILQSSQAHKQSERLLSELQQSAIANEEISQGIDYNFISVMNSLKTLEKNKSKYKIFSDINNVFYIRNSRQLRSKIDYILSYNDSSYYYDLLSNTKMGSFNDTSKYTIDIMPLKLEVFFLDKRKGFLVIKVHSAINLMSENTQFITYKLSNSFCSYINNGIKQTNKRLANKIQLIEYCSRKKFGDIYVPKKIPIRRRSPVIAQNEAYYSLDSSNNEVKEQEEAPRVEEKQGECKEVESGLFCTRVVKNTIKSYIKKGLRFPTIDELLDNFDKEEYESRTIYAPDNQYYFFDEDEGWIEVDSPSSDIVDLILTR